MEQLKLQARLSFISTGLIQGCRTLHCNDLLISDSRLLTYDWFRNKIQFPFLNILECLLALNVL